MRNNTYDFVYLTNTPSFYKLNLCNEISKNKSLLLVFYGYGAEAVNIDLKNNCKWNFDYYFLYDGNSKERNKFLVFFKLLLLMQRISYKRIIYSGWFALEYNLFSFLSPKKKNILVSESSILNVSFKGLKGFLKKMIISRMNYALPSGNPHVELFKSINYKGEIYKTGSVGIFNKLPKHNSNINKPLRYLYVGRLVSVKNISFLINAFNKNGKSLTIVGTGVLEKELKSQANKNISFLGYVENKDLGKIYQSHDIFILPSYYEAWGLVVEEAIYWGLPVIVSDKVGCAIDIVKNNHTGIIFQSNNINSLQEAINNLEKEYVTYKSFVDKIDFNKRDKEQVEAYLKTLE